MDSAEYRQLLRHPKWQRKRLRIFNRDQWKCVACGDDDQELHVHHSYYANGKKPWEYLDSDLVTFCADCHERFHYAESREGIVIPWFSAEMFGQNKIGEECDLLVNYGMILLFERREDDDDDADFIVSTLDRITTRVPVGGAAYFPNPGLKGMQFVKWTLAVQALCMAKWETEDPLECVIQTHETIHVSI